MSFPDRVRRPRQAGPTLGRTGAPRSAAWWRGGRRYLSEAVGDGDLALAVLVHARRTVGGRDVAEAALGVAGYPLWRCVAGQSSHQGAEVLDELPWSASSRDAHRVRRVEDLAADPEVPVLRQCQGQGVLVDHDLDFVPGPFLTGPDVDDGGVAVVERDEVRAAGQRGSLPP